MRVIVDALGRPVMQNGRLRIGEVGEACCCGEPPAPDSCCWDLDRYDCAEQRIACCHLGRRFRVRFLAYVRMEFRQTRAARGWATGQDYQCPPPPGVHREMAEARIDASAEIDCSPDEFGRPQWRAFNLTGGITGRWERWRFDDYLIRTGIWRTPNGVMETMYDGTVAPDELWWRIMVTPPRPILDPHFAVVEGRRYWGLPLYPSWSLTTGEQYPSPVMDREERLACNGERQYPYRNPEPANAYIGSPCTNVTPLPSMRLRWFGNNTCEWSNVTEFIDQDAVTCAAIDTDQGVRFEQYPYGTVTLRNYNEVFVTPLVTCEPPCSDAQLGACMLPGGGCESTTLGGCVARGGVWLRATDCAGAAIASPKGTGHAGGGGCHGCDSAPRPTTPEAMEAWLRSAL